MTEQSDDLRELVAAVAAAYFSNSHVAPSEIPAIVGQIAASLQAVGEPSAVVEEPVEGPAPTRLTPAQVRKSITQNGLVSFEDGKSYKTLRRHLNVKGLSPSDYRTKWGLPADYPMVAPSYSATRSQMAIALGLGRKAAPAPNGAAPAPRRGRPPKATLTES